MFRLFFMLLLLGHILGDFYIQSHKMAQKKDKSLIWVFIHGASYLGAMILVFIPIISWDIVAVLIIVATVHLIIDMVKHFFLLEIVKKGKMSREMERNVFFLDQALHTICIILIAYGMDLYHILAREVINIRDFLLQLEFVSSNYYLGFFATNNSQTKQYCNSKIINDI